MKQSITAIIIVLICISNLFGGTTIKATQMKKVITVYIYPEIINYQTEPLSNGRIGDLRDCWAWEGEQCTDSEFKDYRTAFKFSLSGIPEGAVIEDAWIDVSITNLQDPELTGTWEASIRRVTKDIEGGSSAKEIYDDIDDGTQYFSDSDIVFNDDDPVTYRDDNLISDIESRIDNGWISFGIKADENSPSDDYDLHYARAKLELYIEYQIEFKVDNNFTAFGGTNHGVTNIDGVIVLLIFMQIILIF